eukprot:gene5867-6459_t
MVSFASTQHSVLQPLDLVDYDENQLTFSSSSFSSSNFHRRLEPDPLKAAHSTLHRCRDAGEAYSASYLIHKEHLIHQHTGYHLKWVNCEMASFIMMNARVHHLRNGNGSVLQSVDVLDFSVIHLSTFERLLHRWRWHNKMVDKDKHNLTAIHEAAHYLGQHTMKMRKMNIGLRHEAMNRTVVIMPFLLSDMGAGHSNLINRQAYLAACVWSFYEYYPYVTVAVKSQRDYDYVRNVSGLPLYDILLIEGLPKSASLPVATVQTAKEKIINGSWNFDYIFFTESDQILMMRPVEEIYSYLDSNPRHLVVPHRLMSYPASVLIHHHNRAVDMSGPLDWMDMQCCLPRQYCTERKQWQSIKNASVPVMRIYGLQTALGNANFQAETYRPCQLRPSADQHVCP